MIRSVPTLPGFPDPVQDAQATFRILLSALAHPGRIHRIPVKLDPPVGLNLSCAAACLSLLDLQTQVWTQSLTPEIKNWLGFHTGCRWNSDPQAAQFALIDEPFQMPTLDRFEIGRAHV